MHDHIETEENPFPGQIHLLEVTARKAVFNIRGSKYTFEVAKKHGGVYLRYYSIRLSRELYRAALNRAQEEIAAAREGQWKSRKPRKKDTSHFRQLSLKL